MPPVLCERIEAIGPRMDDCQVVFVTDRTQLERQLFRISRNVGFTVKIADGIAALKTLLCADTSDPVMAVIHEFRDADLPVYPRSAAGRYQRRGESPDREEGRSSVRGA